MVDVDSSLRVQEFNEVAEIVPRSTYYQTELAQSASNNQVTFYITSPGKQLLMSPEAYILFTIKITTGNQATGTSLERFYQMRSAAAAPAGPAAFASDVGETLALRQCYPLMRAIDTASITINGQTFSTQPAHWIDAMNRLYISHEQAATECTISGGEFDEGNHMPIPEDFGRAVSHFNSNVGTSYIALGQGIVDVNNVGNTQHVAMGVVKGDDCFYNKGFSKRYSRLMHKFRKMSANQAVEITTNSGISYYSSGGADQYIQVMEPVLLPPFFMYKHRDSMRSIPHVEQMTIQYNFNSSKLKDLIFQASPAINTTGSIVGRTLLYDDISVSIASDSSKYPELRLKWFLAPDSVSIPPAVSIPVWRNVQYQQAITYKDVIDTGAGTAKTAEIEGQSYNYVNVGSANFNNVRLEQFPDLLLVYLRPSPDIWQGYMPSDANLQVTQLQISVDGMAGKLIDANSQELYKIWLRNVMHDGESKYSYDEWAKRHCVVALRARDLGLVEGPGFDHPLTLNLTVNYANWWFEPLSGRSATSDHVGNAGQDFCGIPGGRNLLPDSGYTTAAPANNKTYPSMVMNLYVQAFYHKYKLTMKSDGKADLQLLKVPPPNRAAPVSNSAADLSSIQF